MQTDSKGGRRMKSISQEMFEYMEETIPNLVLVCSDCGKKTIDVGQKYCLRCGARSYYEEEEK